MGTMSDCICSGCQRAEKAEDAVIDAVAKWFGINREQLLGPNRAVVFAEPRQVAAFLLNRFCGMSLPKTARALRRKDHTTMLYAVRKVERSPLLHAHADMIWHQKTRDEEAA